MSANIQCAVVPTYSWFQQIYFALQCLYDNGFSKYIVCIAVAIRLWFQKIYDVYGSGYIIIYSLYCCDFIFRVTANIYKCILQFLCNYGFSKNAVCLSNIIMVSANI